MQDRQIQGNTIQATTKLYKIRQDQTARDKPTQDGNIQEKTRHFKTVQDNNHEEHARHDNAINGKTKQDITS